MAPKDEKSNKGKSDGDKKGNSGEGKERGNSGNSNGRPGQVMSSIQNFADPITSELPPVLKEPFPAVVSKLDVEPSPSPPPVQQEQPASQAGNPQPNAPSNSPPSTPPSSSPKPAPSKPAASNPAPVSNPAPSNPEPPAPKPIPQPVVSVSPPLMSTEPVAPVTNNQASIPQPPPPEKPVVVITSTTRQEIVPFTVQQTWSDSFVTITTTDSATVTSLSEAQASIMDTFISETESGESITTTTTTSSLAPSSMATSSSTTRFNLANPSLPTTPSTFENSFTAPPPATQLATGWIAMIIISVLIMVFGLVTLYILHKRQTRREVAVESLDDLIWQQKNKKANGLETPRSESIYLEDPQVSAGVVVQEDPAVALAKVSIEKANEPAPVLASNIPSYYANSIVSLDQDTRPSYYSNTPINNSENTSAPMPVATVVHNYRSNSITKVTFAPATLKP